MYMWFHLYLLNIDFCGIIHVKLINENVQFLLTFWIDRKISCSSRKLIKDMQAEIDYLNDRQGKGTPRRGLTPRAGAPRQQSPRYGVTRNEILVKVFAFS